VTGWPIEIFAVDDCSAQLAWRASPGPGLEVEVGDFSARLQASPKAMLALDRVPDGPVDVAACTGVRRYWEGGRALDPAWAGGPGSVLVEGLEPGTCYDVVAKADGRPRFLAGRLRTLRPPEGRLLSRFATVSDLHIGERRFGVMGRVRDAQAGAAAGPDGPVPYPVRALEAAIEEAAAWGAEVIVAKGDLTNLTTAAEVRDVALLFARCPVPVEALLGNHDNNSRVNVRAVLARHGTVVPWQPWARDLAGVRLVLASTAHGEERFHRGQLPQPVARQLARLAAEGGRPAWIGLHHPPERWPFPTVYPPGIPFGEGRAFAAELAKAGVASTCWVSCGHRHRNRCYRYGPVLVTEVSSTKDYPGVWAGYKVFEGGLLQVVRRTARPDVLSWTETTRRAMNGQWGRWSPGRLADRCLVHHWA